MRLMKKQDIGIILGMRNEKNMTIRIKKLLDSGC